MGTLYPAGAKKHRRHGVSCRHGHVVCKWKRVHDEMIVDHGHTNLRAILASYVIFGP